MSKSSRGLATSLDRRAFLAATGALLVLDPPSATAQDAGWKHAASLLGDIKYPPDFANFDYVNPAAPKGGVVRLGVPGTFDSFNPVVAGVKGQVAAGVASLNQSLIVQSLDEVGTAYGLLAEAMRFAPDQSSATYRLRPQARWHDGKPVTVEDVIFSFESVKRYSPLYNKYYLNVVKAEATGEREVTFRFDVKGNRELPQIVGEFPVLPKHWWTGTDANGKQRNVAETTLEPPLGSGPYRIKSFQPGRSLVMERVKDNWSETLNVRVGQDNFDEIRYEYFRDPIVLLEAFKGDNYDFRAENIARQWMTSYDFPAVKEGRVVREEFASRGSGIMQAFAFNTRRPTFRDQRVRRAFNLAYDWEEANKTFFFGLYRRIDSYFFGTELASSGLPEGRELAILETVRDKVPAGVFTTPYTNPVNGSPDAVRNNLREALRLLNAAGWELKERRLVKQGTGESLTAEFLLGEPSFERIVGPFKTALERLGVIATIRTVDDVQYENRKRSFDFDIVVESWAQSLSPGNEQRDYWGSAAAKFAGSRNVVGIADPAIDALIDRIILAEHRDDLVAATKALDRVLLAHDFVVPQWSLGKRWTARWDRFGHPETMPRYGAEAFPSVWWYDEAKAAKTGAAR